MSSMWDSHQPARGHTFSFRGDMCNDNSHFLQWTRPQQTYIVVCFFHVRNLRRCVNVPVRQERKKNKRRKRTRDDYQGSRVAKQQRLHRNTHDQHISSAADNSRHPTSAHSSASGFEDCSDVEISNQTCSDVAVEVNPCSVTLETTRSRELPAKQVSPKSKKGFRDLLAQLRSNSSMIVRETR